MIESMFTTKPKSGAQYNNNLVKKLKGIRWLCGNICRCAWRWMVCKGAWVHAKRLEEDGDINK